MENEEIKIEKVNNLKNGDIIGKDVIVNGKVILEKGRILDKLLIDQLIENNVQAVYIRTKRVENFRIIPIEHIKPGLTAIGPLSDANGNPIFGDDVRKVLSVEDIAAFKARGVKSVRIIQNKASELLFQTYERIEKSYERELETKKKKIKEESRVLLQDLEFKEDVEIRKKIMEDSKVIEEELKESIVRKIPYEEREKLIKKIIKLFEKDEEALILIDSLYETDYKEVLNHGKDLCDLAIKFGRYLNLDIKDLVELGYSAYLSDFSLIEINEKIPILTKNKNKSLIIAEIHKHPLISSEYADKIGLSPRVCRAIREHHEREDGSGYPYGLDSEKISLFAKIIGIIDSYISMIKKRHYKKEVKTPPLALKELVLLSRKNIYSSELVDKFFQMLTMYPVSTIVQLNNGEIGIVTHLNSNYMFLPKVTIIKSMNGDILESPKKVDLVKDNYKIVRTLDNESIKLKKSEILELLVQGEISSSNE
ncbi:MAG TPA: HD domain-containing phosphohydrolase [bacterium]|nr:HD domain-containing phosphohydrolase [bacterium]HOL46810.1 HD domain-containing phosphohydrolase [bacterium]HPQ18664.1 HD domain-containing phosphohydrolase [bacterium]